MQKTLIVYLNIINNTLFTQVVSCYERNQIITIIICSSRLISDIPIDTTTKSFYNSL